MVKVIERKDLEGFWSENRVERYEKAQNKIIEQLQKMDYQYVSKNGCHFIRFMESRLKTPDSIYNKLERKNELSSVKHIEEKIHDLAGVRCICYDIDQVYKVARAMKKKDDFIVVRWKDYIKRKKTCGYQSYHIVFNVDGVEIELQLRTILMDVWSSLDTIVAYKKEEKVPAELKKNIKKLAKVSIKLDKAVHKILKRKIGGS